MRRSKRYIAWLLCAVVLFGGCRASGGETPTGGTATVPVTSTTATTVATTTRPTVPAPAAFRLTDVPIIPQYPQYPTGCESAAAVMALQYAGEPVTMDVFIDKYLTKDTNFYYEDGVHYGPDPWEVFAGDPRTTSSYGCMSPVIKQAMTAYFGTDTRVEDASGLSMQELCERYVAQGIPVVVWVSINMLEVYPTTTWITPDGDPYTWPGNEHCMLLIGYDEEQYYFNDPYKGREMAYSRSRAELRYEALEKQALVVLP